ncbi:hypothetical protein, partial [Marichromatium gracile]|uniref:hypothetical protein n=1 Tax=Marichromatium gracile TaxID=1048 RepID=UPI001F42E41A
MNPDTRILNRQDTKDAKGNKPPAASDQPPVGADPRRLWPHADITHHSLRALRGFAVQSWRLAAGGWRLAAGGWRLAA